MQGEVEAPRAKALFPKLTPRRNAPAQAVAAHQRARLHAAMIEACARHGFERTTARELAALAGVSTKTLYKHFASKEACFLATYDLVVQQAMGRITTAYRDEAPGAEPDWAGGLCRAFEAFADELVQRPAPSRLALVEILAAAPDAFERIERTEAMFTAMIATSLAQAADGVEIPPAIVRALVGGVWFVARTRFLEGRAEAIAAGGAELREWLLVYRSPAGALLPPGRIRRPVAGTGRRVDPGRTERSRMLEAAAATVARGGYRALSPGHVAGAAGVSEAAFSTQFESTEACFLAMLEWLCARALAEALHEGEGAPTWASGICRAMEARFCRFASDAALARAAFLDAFAAGPAAAECRSAIMRGFADALARRAPADGRPSPLVAEAIVGSVWSIAHRHIVRGRRDSLPASSSRAAFVTLAPLIGAEAALAAIRRELDPSLMDKNLVIS